MRIGLIGTGEMGSAIGARLRERGAIVVTSLRGRSAASAERIARAGVTVVDDEDAVVTGSRFVLSIVPPGEARAVAEQFVPALTRVTVKPVFVDCNAIAPTTMTELAKVIATSGAPCADVGIIGSAPKGDDGPHLYVSGPPASHVAELNAFGLIVRVIPGDVGVASGLKMSYAGITKGVTGVGAAMMAAAERHGLLDALRSEMAESQPMLLAHLERSIPNMQPKAYRWVAEMHEIATFQAAEPGAAMMYEGLSTLYAAIAERRAAGSAAHGGSRQ